MKYFKPEVEIKKISTIQSIAGTLDGWLEGTEYQESEEYITDFIFES